MRPSHASVCPHNFSALSQVSAITLWNVFKNSAGVYEAKIVFNGLSYSTNFTLSKMHSGEINMQGLQCYFRKLVTDVLLLT